MAAKELYNTSLFLDANLRAYYRFNSGSLVTDNSSNGKNLTNNDSVSETPSGKFGYGADFGTGGSKSLYTDKLSYDGGNFTMLGWFKLNSTRDIQDLLTVVDNTSKTALILRYRSSNKIIFNRLKIGVVDQQFEYSFSPGTSDFHHYAIVYNGSSVVGYIDGSSIGSVSASGNGSGTGSEGFFISRSGAYIDAVSDDVAIFNRALSGTEISNLYNGNYPDRIPAVKTNWFL